jgi:alcohol dehydrogenase YqhD (iron-dependent ADH family)
MQFSLFNPTRIIFGENTIEQIGGAIAEGGYERVLLVAGGGSIKQNGVYDTVISSLADANIERVECWGVRPNPVLGKVGEAIEIARVNNVQAVLAVGGGSVIDTAKAVAAGVFLDDIWQAFEWKVPITQALPIFTVLTLSATGSEMNGNAVLTNEQENKKWGIGNRLLYPKVSIVDPSVQKTLPWDQTVNGALDAIAHILEFYFHGTNLAWAATLALNGIGGAGMRGGEWACHDIEHSISCLYPEIAHGAGLGIVFPAWMLFTHEANPKQFARFARNIWDCDDIEKAVFKMRAKIESWKGFVRLRDLGIAKDRLSAIATNATMIRSLGRLRVLERSDVESILNIAY